MADPGADPYMEPAMDETEVALWGICGILLCLGFTW